MSESNKKRFDKEMSKPFSESVQKLGDDLSKQHSKSLQELKSEYIRILTTPSKPHKKTKEDRIDRILEKGMIASMVLLGFFLIGIVAHRLFS